VVLPRCHCGVNRKEKGTMLSIRTSRLPALRIAHRVRKHRKPSPRIGPISQKKGGYFAHWNDAQDAISFKKGGAR